MGRTEVEGGGGVAEVLGLGLVVAERPLLPVPRQQEVAVLEQGRVDAAGRHGGLRVGGHGVGGAAVHRRDEDRLDGVAGGDEGKSLGHAVVERVAAVLALIGN